MELDLLVDPFSGNFSIQESLVLLWPVLFYFGAFFIVIAINSHLSCISLRLRLL